MPAVTVVNQITNVNGDLREKYFKINIANTGDTLATGLKLIKSLTANDVAITKMAPSGGTVTFTTTGAVTGAFVKFAGV